jgi:hypothetical protein
MVIDRTLGEEIVGQQSPLTTTAMEIPNRVEDCPHIDLARAPSSLVWLGGREQRRHQRPLLVRQLGWIPLSGLVLL